MATHQFRKHCQSQQQPLNFGEGEEPDMGGLSILWGDLKTP